MELVELIGKFPGDNTLKTHARPYFNHSVEFKQLFTPEERARMLQKVGLNVFYFPSDMISGCDLLSDSGVTTMTNEQWAALHVGDESYGSNRGYFILMQQVRELFGEAFFNAPTSLTQNAFIFHQGRPSEDALFTILGKRGPGQIVPSNGHFDTTEGNLQANRIHAMNLFAPELTDEHSVSHFKGNMNVEKFRALLEKDHNKIPLAYLTITNNTGGGQPVSMQNIKDVSKLAHTFNVPLFFDACRYAENAWFIKQYESGYNEKTIAEIVKEMFSFVDGFTISFKKDGMVNMGGGLFLRDKGLFIERYPTIPDELINYQLMKEGHPSYGGLAGREIMALSVGLTLSVKDEYLRHRIEQVQAFGEAMSLTGLPVLTPIGGHAIYLDVNRFFAGTALRPEDFGGIALTAVLLATYGHRACELGYFAFGHYDPATGADTFPEVNFVRFAVPRLRYEKQDLDSVIEAVKILYERRSEIPPVTVTYGRELLLRHFKARFAFAG